MPTTIGILTSTGILPTNYSANSLNDAAQYEPIGIYTVTRTYNRNAALKLDAHLDRLEESARLENIPLGLDRATLRAALRAMIDQSGYPESRFRITIPQQQPDHIIITLEPFAGIPAEVKQNGVVVATIEISRDNPQAKETQWMAKREAAKANAMAAYEYIIVNEQHQLLEGFGSNFYAILEDTLWTAPDGTVLGGISRQIALEIAPSVLPIRQQAITQDQINALQGAFLTSSSRGIVPIVQINDHRIGDGKPTAHVQALSAHYDEWVEHHLEPI